VTEKRSNSSTTRTDSLHPVVYLALIGVTVWFVAAAWQFGVSAYTDYLLTVVSGFAVIFVALPSALWFTAARHERSLQSNTGNESFREWARKEFETWQGRRSGSNVVIEILLPMAAAAIGMTAIGWVLHLTGQGAV
jgi:hypothetical protein